MCGIKYERNFNVCASVTLCEPFVELLLKWIWIIIKRDDDEFAQLLFVNRGKENLIKIIFNILKKKGTGYYTLLISYFLYILLYILFAISSDTIFIHMYKNFFPSS